MNPRLLFPLTAALLAWPATASAAGPWMTTNPGGTTYTIDATGTVRLDITTTDGYPGRENISQAYELVLVLRNGVIVGRTTDLADRVGFAQSFSSVTFEASAGDTVRVVHSSVVGLFDGTPNSVVPTIAFSLTPAPVEPSTTPVPETVPPTTAAATTTVVAVDIPPTLPASSTTLPAPEPTPGTPVPADRIPVVEPPRATSPTTASNPPVSSAPAADLPKTGPTDDTRLIAHIAAIVLAVGALVRLRWGVRR
jgi:hypothetical protein